MTTDDLLLKLLAESVSKSKMPLNYANRNNRKPLDSLGSTLYRSPSMLKQSNYKEEFSKRKGIGDEGIKKP